MKAPPFISGLILHTPSCSCWLCTTDHVDAQRIADQDRADREENAESDADVEWNRARGMERPA